MNSEKVKEIKKALECLSGHKACDLCFYHELAEHQETTCINLVAEDLIDYINELESENERLTKQYVDWKDLYYENTKRVKKLKDRIAELEKEKKEHGKKKFLRGWKLGIEEIAERLKEKLKARHEVNRLLLMPVRDVVLSTIEGLLEDVDKTLKELINEQVTKIFL